MLRLNRLDAKRRPMISTQDRLDLEAAAQRIALKKMNELPSDPGTIQPRLPTGGAFKDLFMGDTATTCMWAMHFGDAFPVTESLDHFYRLQDEDGFINRQFQPNGQPKFLKGHPVSWGMILLAWAESELYALRGDRQRLAKVYPHLKRHHEYCRKTFRMEDGLYTGCPLGCGMDNLPRWPTGWKDDGKGIKLREAFVGPGVEINKWIRHYLDSDAYAWNLQGRFIDMSGQMAMDARFLGEMAEVLGHAADAAVWRAEHAELGDRINERMWHEELGAYVDLGYGEWIPHLHIGGFWPLLAGIVPGERLPRVIDLLTDERHFGRPTPVPSLAASDPDYTEGGKYWRGGTWAPTNYMVLKGLALNGAMDVAKAIARKYVAAVNQVFRETGTFWENYDPERRAQGGMSAPDFVGWSGLAAVSIPREFL